MTVQTVLQHPNKTLQQKSREVEVSEILTPEFQTLLDDMIETMAVENGVGIAAPQIGILKRVAIVETPAGPTPFINPVITKTSIRIIDSDEGCLSVPGVFGIVKRHKHVKLNAIDRNGNEVSIKAGGFLGTIFQHEIDHLDGVLFIDKAEQLEKCDPAKKEQKDLKNRLLKKKVR